MPAIGSGVTLICGNQLDGFAGSPPPSGVRDAMIPVSLGLFDQVVLSHFVGRKAWQIIVTDDNGNTQPSAAFPAIQALNARPLPDTITIANASGAPATVFIAIRWQENSVEAQLFPIGTLNDEERIRTSTWGNASVTIESITPPIT